MVTLWSHQCPKNGIYEVSERLAQKKEWLCYAIFERCTWNKPQHLFLRTRGSGVRIPPGVPTENRLTVRIERFFLYIAPGKLGQKTDFKCPLCGQKILLRHAKATSYAGGSLLCVCPDSIISSYQAAYSVGGIMVDRSDNSVRKIRLFKIGYSLRGQTN